MIQMALSLTIVAATAGWMLWRGMAPAIRRNAPAPQACGCGAEAGSCRR